MLMILNSDENFASAQIHLKPNVIKTVQDFERGELKDGCCAGLSYTDIDFQIDTKK